MYFLSKQYFVENKVIYIKNRCCFQSRPDKLLKMPQSNKTASLMQWIKTARTCLFWTEHNTCISRTSLKQGLAFRNSRFEKVFSRDIDQQICYLKHYNTRLVQALDQCSGLNINNYYWAWAENETQANTHVCKQKRRQRYCPIRLMTCYRKFPQCLLMKEVDGCFDDCHQCN